MIRAFTVLPSLRLNESTCVLPFSTNDFNILLVIFLPAYSFQMTNVQPSLKREQPYPFLPSMICPLQPGEGHEARTSLTPDCGEALVRTAVCVLELVLAAEAFLEPARFVELFAADDLRAEVPFPLPLPPRVSSPKALAAAGV